MNNLWSCSLSSESGRKSLHALRPTAATTSNSIRACVGSAVEALPGAQRWECAESVTKVFEVDSGWMVLGVTHEVFISMAAAELRVSEEFERQRVAKGSEDAPRDRIGYSE